MFSLAKPLPQITDIFCLKLYALNCNTALLKVQKTFEVRRLIPEFNEVYVISH
jgi:hypothetical protein